MHYLNVPPSMITIGRGVDRSIRCAAGHLGAQKITNNNPF